MTDLDDDHTLAGFLRARLAEEQPTDQRGRAELDAKLRLIDEFDHIYEEVQRTRDTRKVGEAFGLLRGIAYHAEVYEDHPDYHSSWRP